MLISEKLQTFNNCMCSKCNKYGDNKAHPCKNYSNKIWDSSFKDFPYDSININKKRSFPQHIND